jgi:hypothetical protein
MRDRSDRHATQSEGGEETHHANEDVWKRNSHEHLQARA